MDYEDWSALAALLSVGCATLWYTTGEELAGAASGILAGIAIVCWVQR